jgi:hypothetical protein
MDVGPATDPSGVLGVHHVGLVVRDLVEAQRFCEDRLGLTRIP